MSACPREHIDFRVRFHDFFAEGSVFFPSPQGTNLIATPVKILSEFGIRGLFRGLTACAIRDGIYVGGLLGVTPVLQNWLVKEHNVGMSASGNATWLFSNVHRSGSLLHQHTTFATDSNITTHLGWFV